MANGYCPALLRHINDVAEGNAPGKKAHISGFMRMLFCCQNSSVSPVNDGNEADGHVKTLTVKYRQRPVASHVTDEDTCELNRIPTYSEWNLPSLLYRQTSFFLADSEIQKYCNDASRAASLGGGATGFMKEHFDIYIEHVNILMKAINTALVTEMATQFGDNVTTGSSAGKVININRAGHDLTLNDGVIELMNDLRENENCDDVCMVGGGIISAYDAARPTIGLSQAGVDGGRLAWPGVFFDKDTQTIWGQDSFGVFAKGSVKFLGRNRYAGNFGGAKGQSIFLTIPFPVGEFAGCVDFLQCLRDLRVDVQMRYIDCPTEIDVQGVPTTVNRGWQVILSKYFNLWVQPTTAYDATDPLEGTNGTLKYFAMNDCKDCDDTVGAYAYEG